MQTHDERDPEHLQLRREVERGVAHDALQVAELPGHALHGRGASHERLRVRRLHRLLAKGEEEVSPSRRDNFICDYLYVF